MNNLDSETMASQWQSLCSLSAQPEPSQTKRDFISGRFFSLHSIHAKIYAVEIIDLTVSSAFESYLKSEKRKQKQKWNEKFLPFAGALNFYCFKLSSSSSVTDFISRFSFFRCSSAFRLFSFFAAHRCRCFLCRFARAWLLRVIICSPSTSYTYTKQVEIRADYTFANGFPFFHSPSHHRTIAQFAQSMNVYRW